MLLDALESLTYQTLHENHSIEILVIDNASTDNTKSTVQDFARKNPSFNIKYIYEKLEGQANALNTGVRNSSGKWLAFFDDDQIAEPNWLEELLKVANENNTKYVGGAVHLNLSSQELDRMGTIERKFQREIKYYDKPHIYNKKIYQLPSSGNMLIERTVFDKVGFFDSSMLTGAFDTDFCLRARRVGYEPWFAPYAIIRHKVLKNRLTPRYMRWGELKNGATLAFLDNNYKGKLMILFLCLARIGQAIIIHIPLLLFGLIRRNRVKVQEYLCLLSRAEGYTRKTISLIAPTFLPQSRWWGSLAQREGLNIGKTHGDDN
jgi:GT2 family glycosyltransferase